MSRLDLRAESDVRAHTQTRAHTRAAGPEAFEAVVHRTHTRARARAQLQPGDSHGDMVTTFTPDYDIQIYNRLYIYIYIYIYR